jgi:membrane-bound lytic murein transglycosylase D
MAKGEGGKMTRTEMPRTIFYGALMLAVLAVLAGCSTTPKTAASKPVCDTCKLDNQAEYTQVKREHAKTELVVPDEPAVDLWTRRYAGEKHKGFQVLLDRAQDYVVPCQEIFRQQGVPEDLVYVALVESGFTPTARSHANAVGMFQFIETTGKRYRLEQNHWIDERRHPLKAARAAAEYLSFLYDTLGSWPLAIAGYNCGEKAVQAALDQSKLQTFWELAQSGYLPLETREYVPKVYATVKIARNTKLYGFHYNPQHYAPKHETVSVPGGVKLSWIEKQTGVPESSLRTCNPELCQAATPPGDSAYELCVPIGTGGSVQTALATCPLPPPEEKAVARALPVREERPAAESLALKNAGEARSVVAAGPSSCTVKPGDTWFSLARKYQCSVADLASYNGLKPTAQSLKTGQTLKVPPTGQVMLAAAKKDASAKHSTPLAMPAKATAPAKKVCIAYPVRPGDTLYSIAGKFHVSVEELSTNNRLRQGQKLVAGNTLNICSSDSMSNDRTAKKRN